MAEAASRLGQDVRWIADPVEAVSVATTEAVFPVVVVGNDFRQCDWFDSSVLQTISALRRASTMSQIILLTPDAADLESCCHAIQNGANDFLEVRGGRVDADALSRRLSQARQRFERQVSAARSMHTNLTADQTGIVAQSRAMSDVVSQAARAAQISDAPVLIHGESGTGKQLLAELIHRLDPKRSAKPMLTVNCAAITGTLAESALFGHVKGAYTGATTTRAGYFRSADRGVILLDEIGELELALQPKLLRVLQEGLILPVGADVEEAVDVRVLAATNQPLRKLVDRRKFRLDLYQRLNVISIQVPPLRERPEDVAALLSHFIRKYANHYGHEIVAVDPRVCEFLTNCALEGNVRELENTVRRILALKTSGDEIRLADLPETLRSSHANGERPIFPRELVESVCRLIDQGKVTLPDFVAECERQVLSGAIQRTKGTSTDLARKLGLSRRTYYNKRRKYGI